MMKKIIWLILAHLSHEVTIFKLSFLLLKILSPKNIICIVIFNGQKCKIVFIYTIIHSPNSQLIEKNQTSIWTKFHESKSFHVFQNTHVYILNIYSTHPNTLKKIYFIPLDTNAQPWQPNSCHAQPRQSNLWPRVAMTPKPLATRGHGSQTHGHVRQWKPNPCPRTQTFGYARPWKPNPCAKF